MNEWGRIMDVHVQAHSICKDQQIHVHIHVHVHVADQPYLLKLYKK